MTYYINDWAVRDGFIPPLLLLMGMAVGFTIIGMVLLVIFGKSARRLTRNSKVHTAAKAYRGRRGAKVEFIFSNARHCTAV